MVLWIVLACVLGMAASLQGATNGLLSHRIGLPVTVMLTSIVVLIASLVWWVWARGGAEPAPVVPAGTPSGFWLYLGGVYGVLILGIAAYLFPRLGAGPTTAIMVAAQLVTALSLDHVGVLGSRLPVTPLRLGGAVLLVCGAVLVLWPRLRA